MTSKHLFFKVMREDLRHKTWMIALSALGSFLTMPVAWLIVRNNMNFDYEKSTMTSQRALYYLEDIYLFYSEYLVIMGGIIAIAGALIVGLCGFRYVFHKNMVDTWHSMPIKRTTLFGACWLNGFLIWLIPFIVGLALTLFMCSGFAVEVSSLCTVSAGYAIGMTVKEAALTSLTLFVVFLLVYNTVLFAVMLSGNILNTLVSLGIIGFGVIGIFGLCIVYFEYYMETFYSAMLNWNNVVYGSPLFAAGYLLYVRGDYANMNVSSGQWQYGPSLLINLLIAVALGGGAWYLYKKRASELAEQGIKNKPLIALMKLIVGVAGGMCGWLLMTALTYDYTAIWGIFGCVLVAVLAFGIMDIIFHMDFKAFFAHKAQMGVTTILAILMCFAFEADWFGYDDYLPEKEEIAYMAIYSSNFANRYFYGGVNGVEPLENIHFEDTDAIYNFLERVTGVTESPKQNGGGYAERVSVKVTLKNGKSYYRYYLVSDRDDDVAWPLLTSTQYLEQTYLLDEEEIEGCYELMFDRYDRYEYIRNDKINTEQVRAIMEAYNQDIINNPDLALVGEGRLLTQITCEISDSNDDYYSVYLDVYDTMVNTVRALQTEGYGEWVEEVAPEGIKELRLYLGYYPDKDATPEELIELARDTYGFYTAQEVSENEVYREATTIVCEVGGEPYLTITDKNEIAEILNNCDYNSAYRSGSVFRKGTVGISYTDINGEEGRYFLHDGALPEKYIQRFGEIDLSQYGVNEYYY